MALRGWSDIDATIRLYEPPSNSLTEGVAWVWGYAHGLPGVAYISDFVEVVLYWFVLWPLEYIYFRGPALGGWGFWDGMHPHDICAVLTGHRIRFSDGSKDLECQDLLRRKVQGFAGTLLVCGYACIALSLIRKVRWRSRGSSSRNRSTTRLVDTPTPTP